MPLMPTGAHYPDAVAREQQVMAAGITTIPRARRRLSRAKNIRPTLRAGVAAPSMEDDVLDAIEAAGWG